MSTDVQFGLNGGLAVPLPVSRRVAIVPEFRIRSIRRSSGEAEYLGVGGYAYQFGATVRFTFD